MSTNKLNKNMRTVGFMTFFALVIVLSYYFLTTSDKPADKSATAQTEYEQIINIDLEANYPATPREVTKLFGRIIKYLYDQPKEEEIRPLALKVRKLYDEAFLEHNPEDEYLNELYAELASWQEDKRRITNYLLTNEDLEEESVIEGVKYAIKYVTYTIKEKAKFTETWKVLLKQDEESRWKIVGWEFVPASNK